MKRVLIIIFLILSIWFAYTVVTNGVNIEKFNLKIAGYNEIKNDSEEMTKELAAYNKRNKNDYETALTGLNSSIKTYKDAKAEYENVVEELNLNSTGENGVVVPQKEVYDIDYLWTRIGNYARREGVDLTMYVEKDSLLDTTALGYVTCILKFSLNAGYMNASNFIDDLEKDDELGFEIRDFRMTSKSSQFSVYNIPVNEAVITQFQTQSNNQNQDNNQDSTNSNNTQTGNSSNNQIVGNETVSPNNTSNSTNNETSNIVNNSTANNTVQ